MHWFWRVMIAVVAGVVIGIPAHIGSVMVCWYAVRSEWIPDARPGGNLLPYRLLTYTLDALSYALACGVSLGVYGPLFTRLRAAKENRRRKKGLCIKCGYDLTGNVSGICPECGEKI